VSSRAASAFRRQVDAWVIAEVQKGVATFDDLICRLPGVYPTHAYDSLGRLCQSGAISRAEYRRANRRRDTEVAVRRHPDVPSLPPPHPLDYDWRYSPATVDYLLQLAVTATEPGDTIALLGTPSIHVAQLTRELHRRFVLIDVSPATVHQVRKLDAHRTVYRRDLFVDPVPTLGAAAVIADPPWYDEHIEAFLWTASECARTDATVLVSLPQVGTRPGSRAERKAFRSVAERMSLLVREMRLGTLTYLSPPFEVNALAAAGWTGLPTDWRRGDLGILRKTGPNGERPSPDRRDARWDEHSLGSVRIRVRRDPPIRIVEPTMGELVPGGVLADVSRRHQYRKVANVWTSGNRVYVSRSPRVLVRILEALSRGSDPRNAVASTIGRALTVDEERDIARTVGQLNWLARIEGRELSRHGWHPHRARRRTAS